MFTQASIGRPDRTDRVSTARVEISSDINSMVVHIRLRPEMVRFSTRSQRRRMAVRSSANSKLARRNVRRARNNCLTYENAVIATKQKREMKNPPGANERQAKRHVRHSERYQGDASASGGSVAPLASADPASQRVATRGKPSWRQ